MLDREDSIKKSAEIAASADWSNPIWHGAYHQTLTCAHCGTEYRGHAKTTKIGDSYGLISKNGCPACTGHGLQAARSDPEIWGLNQDRNE